MTVDPTTVNPSGASGGESFARGHAAALHPLSGSGARLECGYATPCASVATVRNHPQR